MPQPDYSDLPGADNSNYQSVTCRRNLILEELEKEVAFGRMLRFNEREAYSIYGEKLVIASLGAIEKDGGQSVRVLTDGTHHVPINPSIRLRDADRGPQAPDLRRIQQEQATLEADAMGLIVDIKSAHRLIPIHPDDHHLVACRLDSGGPIYVNVVGTFGISSAPYWWSRVGSALLRLGYYLLGEAVPQFSVVVCDDFRFEVCSTNPAPSLLLLLWMILVLGAPVSWPKVRGGVEYPYVGLYLVLKREFCLGLSESRATWIVDWIQRTLIKSSVSIAEFTEALGRLSFSVQALVWDKPFLAPLYAFIAVRNPGSFSPLPTFVRLVLSHLSSRIQKRRLYPQCAQVCTACGSATV